MEWWHWALLGLALLGLELLTPGGFYVLFFGIAALVVGMLVGMGIGWPEWVSWLLFSAISVISLLLFRGPLLARMQQGAHGAPVDSLIGEVAVLLGDLTPGAVGKAELRGTAWNARNGDSQSLSKGQRVRVERVDGLMLSVRAE